MWPYAFGQAAAKLQLARGMISDIDACRQASLWLIQSSELSPVSALMIGSDPSDIADAAFLASMRAC